MATTAREALHTFLVNLQDAQKLNPPTPAQYAEALAGYPSIPNLNDPDRKVLSILDLRTAVALPPFTSGLVFIPDPRNGGVDQAVHDKFRDLTVAAWAERSEETA